MLLPPCAHQIPSRLPPLLGKSPLLLKTESFRLGSSRASPGSPGPPPPEPLPGSLGRGSPHSPHQRAQAVPRRLHGRAAAGPPRQRDLSGAGGAAPPRGGPSPPLPPPRPCPGGVRGKGGGGGFSPTICPGEEREGFCSARIGVTYYLLASYKPI